jgi:hypothetical protein
MASSMGPAGYPSAVVHFMDMAKIKAISFVSERLLVELA